MPSSGKRKESPSEEADASQPSKRRSVDRATEPEESGKQPSTSTDVVDETPDNTTTPSTSSATQDRQARFKALQARAKKAANHNLEAARKESQRLATDPSLLHKLSRRADEASHNLLKADTEAAGEDFERKRAWDWTIEESERWDKRMEKKQRHRDDVAFQDYRQDARKVYKRQIKGVNADLEGYEKEKMKAIEKAAASGSLEVIELEGTGELVAVDKDGIFYSTADNTDFTENKPERAAVDRLVEDLKKAEEVSLRKRRARLRKDDDPDVTYINEKNKEFNKRLQRAYGKYTAEIRDNFERGTAL